MPVTQTPQVPQWQQDTKTTAPKTGVPLLPQAPKIEEPVWPERVKRSVGGEQVDEEDAEDLASWREEAAELRRTTHKAEPMPDEIDLDRKGPKMPLALMLGATFIVATGIALLGRNNGYWSYDWDWKGKSLMTLVFEGLHDNINPYDAIFGTFERPQPVEETATEAATLLATEVASEADTEEVIDLNVPETSTNPVMQAADYGMANPALMSPQGTTYERLTYGAFAPNGTYYDLQEVDVSYLKDALFIGDSRTDGLRLFGDLKEKTSFWAKESLSANRILDQTIPLYRQDGTEEELPLRQVLENNNYRKVYLSVGINELGIPNTLTYFEQYRELVGLIRKLQPDAIIYIQGIMHVTQAYSQRDGVFNNTSIVERNTALASLANGRDIIYLDMNPAVCDENGDLNPEYTGDGIHLKASAYALWVQNILENAIVREDADWAAKGEMDAAGEGSTEATTILEDGTVVILDTDRTGVTGEGTGTAESDVNTETGTVIQ